MIIEKTDFKIEKTILHAKNGTKIAVETEGERDRAYADGYKNSPADFINEVEKVIESEPEKETVSNEKSDSVKEAVEIKKSNKRK